MTVQMYLLFGVKVHKDKEARINFTSMVAQGMCTALARAWLCYRCSNTKTQTATSVVLKWGCRFFRRLNSLGKHL